MTAIQKIWTAEDDEVLRYYYRRIPAAEIGKMIGANKNMVISRANRIGLGQRKPDPYSDTVSRPTTTIDLPGRAKGCQWIDGDPLERHWTFCGAPLKDGSRFSFCETHHKRVFRKSEGKAPEGFLWGRKR